MSNLSMTFGHPMPFVLDSEDDEPRDDSSLMDVPEETELRDSVGLLLTSEQNPRSSRTSLRQFTSGLHRRANGSRSRSGTGTSSRSASRSRTTSSNSHSGSARSRAQSLIHSLGAASRSSLEIVVRSRASSMARLSDSPYYSTSPDPLPSSPENNTFGLARATRRPRADDDQSVSDVPDLPSPIAAEPNVASLGDDTISLPARRRLMSDVSRLAPSERTELSVQTERAAPQSPPRSPALPPSPPATQVQTQEQAQTETPHTPTAPVPIPGRADASMPDLSTADASLVTGPATVQGTTDASRTPSSWGTPFARGEEPA